MVKHKPYRDLQALPVPNHQCKNLLMDFVIRLPISTNWKSKSYNFILVIIDRLTKIVYYESVKVIVNAPELAKVIFNIVVQHHSLPNLIVSNKSLLFTFKFWSLLCYFLDIKQKLSTAFHPQINIQAERQNSTIEAYL